MQKHFHVFHKNLFSENYCTFIPQTITEPCLSFIVVVANAENVQLLPEEPQNVSGHDYRIIYSVMWFQELKLVLWVLKSCLSKLFGIPGTKQRSASPIALKNDMNSSNAFETAFHVIAKTFLCILTVPWKNNSDIFCGSVTWNVEANVQWESYLRKKEQGRLLNSNSKTWPLESSSMPMLFFHLLFASLLYPKRFLASCFAPLSK